MQPITIPVKYIIWLIGSFIVLSSAGSAMDPKDRTLYGFTRRFLLNLTMSAREAVQQDLHIQLPDVPTTPEEPAQTK